MNVSSSEIARVLLHVLVIGGLLIGSAWTLLPFLGETIWAATIVIATWPVLLRVQKLAGGRRGIAVTVMTLLVLLAFVVPFWLAIDALVNAATHSPAVLRDFLTRGLGPPPDWAGKIPFFGERLVNRWQELAAGGSEALAEALRPYAGVVADWTIAVTGGTGKALIYVLLTVIVVAILYARGEMAARGVLALAFRLGGEAGERTVRLAGLATRSVALGVVVTALIQALLTGLGLWAVGVPHPELLTAIAFVLTIAQLGPALVLIPAVIWLFWTGSTGWGTALLLWTVLVIPLDNVLKPILIRRGVQLPMLLIIAGVIGGLIGFGIIGLFVGPVVLAATYTLAKDWLTRDAVAVSGERANKT